MQLSTWMIVLPLTDLWQKSLILRTKRQLVYISQGKGDNSKNLECGKMGPRPGRAGIFFFKLTTWVTSNHYNIFTLFSDSKILFKCWTLPSLKDLMWNIKYFLDMKKTRSGFVLILPTTRDDLEILWLCQMNRNDRLYKTKIATAAV